MAQQSAAVPSVAAEKAARLQSDLPYRPAIRPRLPERSVNDACGAQIEMGSTNVRVGSTIFGARNYGEK